MKSLDSRSRSRIGAWAVLMLALAVGNSAARAAGMQELVRETQRISDSGGQMTMVWWLPPQFWEESLKANPAMPAEARAQVLSALADYTIVAMVRARIGAAALVDVQPKAELLKNMRVEMDGKVIEPLAPERISAVAQLLMSQLKPAMAQMAGAVGSAMEFVVYPSKAADGKLLADATQPGTLTMKLYEQTFKWRLPLGSLLPDRIDRKTGEEFPGNYQFNPFTGDALKPR